MSLQGPALGRTPGRFGGRAGEVAAPQLSEDFVKASVAAWLEGSGRAVRVAQDHAHGIDIKARRGSERWVIEVKGTGSRPEMRINYFLAVLGCLLQRMDDEAAAYSVALPEHPQFERLWARLPHLAKLRTRITLLSVAEDGSVSERR